MKPEELMIGDWVECGINCTGRITQIGGTIMCVRLSKGDLIIEADEVKPIPLTPEILEKNGFEKELSEDNIHYRFILIHDGVRFSLLYARSVFQWLGPLDFKYVHELQHAMRLCGVEKEIEI